MIKIKNPLAYFSNFTVFLCAILCCISCFVFAVVDVVDSSGGVNVRILGIISGLCCFLIIFNRLKKFTFLVRIASYILLIVTSCFIFYSIDWLCSH